MKTYPVKAPRKLIEVAMPLDAINAASKREGFIYRGNPSALHKWWAQRPLAAARAVIFGQLINDPEDLWRCQNPGKEPLPQNKTAWTKARARLFKIIEDLVVWENATNQEVITAARDAIIESWRQTCELNKSHPEAANLFDPDKLPGLHDPFAGGGAIPLEAQRLGLEAFASDLNPVAVLINKAMIEIPPRFSNRAPVHPAARSATPLVAPEWKGVDGLAEDVRLYGQWMKNEAEKRIGQLYPAIEVTKEMAIERPDLEPLVGQRLRVITWLWARTVRSPNPAFADIEVPLASTFVLSSKPFREVYVEPVIEKGGYRFTIKVGKLSVEAKGGTSFGKQRGFRCLMSQTPISYDYIRAEARAGRMGQKLMSIVAESSKGRVYLPPSVEHERVAFSAKPEWKPELNIPDQALGFRVQLYGMQTYADLFTQRQLVALTQFSDLVSEARERIRCDAVSAGVPDDDSGLNLGGVGARAYAEAVSMYLAFAVDKSAEYGCTIVPWYSKEDRPKGLFARQAIPMVWDFAEVNPLCGIGGSLEASVAIVAQALNGCNGQVTTGHAEQVEARSSGDRSKLAFVSTDPPYYDNIGYADLSDFFYVWLRKSLQPVFPSLLSTIAVPKADELVATPFRHGSKVKAEKFFLAGMTDVMRRLCREAHPSSPITIYYAFKQSETKHEGTSSTGWETFLDAVIGSGLSISGTWPMRTERAERSVGLGTNSLASSIILVCRPRPHSAGTISRRQFVRLLNEALPAALDTMTRESEGLHSPVTPVDLSQAIIGPGMAIFSRYEAVLEADGTPMTVRTALQLINRFLAEDDFDHDTQFCLHWFEQNGWKEGKFGDADTLARAKGTSVDGVKQAGVLFASAGVVRLLKWSDYPKDWDPSTDERLPVWEGLHHLIRVFKTDGESGAGVALAAIHPKAEAMRQLAYRLYTLCERAGWADDARVYDDLVKSWSAIESAAATVPGPQQATLFG